MSLNSIISEKEADSSLYLHIDVSQALLVEALKKDKKEPDDLMRIYEAVLGLKFFKNLFADADTNQNSDVLMRLCANIKYEYIEMGKFVFRQNDSSNDKFYVILSGEVGILTNANYSDVYAKDREVYERTTRLTYVGKLPSYKTLNNVNSLSHLEAGSKQELDSVDDVSKAQQTPRNTFKSSIIMHKDTKGTSIISLGRSTRRLTHSTKSPKDKFKNTLVKVKQSEHELKEQDEKDDDDDEVDDEGDEQDRSPNHKADFKHYAARFGHLVRILGKGAEFGDAALKEPGKKRSASILCKTDCEFLVINSQTYNDLIKKNSELKSEFLLKSFSFLSSVSSSQIKSKITYSFFSEGFSEGYVLMQEGVILKRPKLCLIEFGECKVQKKYVIAVKNPFHSDDILREEVHWLTLCTVGPGALLGEEILEQKRQHEHYHYRVTVTSSRLSALSIYKSTFVKIHTELEDQTRIYYEIKRKQREETYAQLVAEIESKRKSLNKAEQFLGKHASMARVINKSTISTFNQRVMREAKTLVKENTKLNPGLAFSTNLSTSDYSLLRSSTSHTTRPELFRTGPQSPNRRTLKAETITFTNVPTENQQLQGFSTIKSEQFSVMALQTDPIIAANVFKSLKNELSNESKSYQLDIDPSPSNESIKIRINKNRSMFLATRGPQPGEQSSQGTLLNLKPNYTEELMSISQTEKHTHAKHNSKRFSRKSTSKRPRIRVEGEAEDTFETIRDSKQEVCHMNYLGNTPLESVDQNRVENLKFVFADDEESRVRLINKQKHLRKGVFGEVSKLNYLQHDHKLGNSLKFRLTRMKTPNIGQDQKIAHNITYTTPISNPFPERPNSSIPSNFLLSPRLFPNSSTSRPITSVGPISEHKKKHGKNYFNLSPHFSRESDFSSRVEGGRGFNQIADDLLHLSKDNSKGSLFELPDDPFASPVPVIRASGGDKLTKEIKVNNPIYQNLVLKDLMHKKLHHKRLSSNMPKAPSSKGDKMLETTISFNSIRIPSDIRDIRTPLPSSKDIQ